jgi:hypothetical protein
MQPYSQYAELQDYNYFLPSTVNIRYSGSYLQGALYNTWSVGDISYGNQPVINYYSDKLALFTQIQSSSFFPGAVNASLAYLADVTGGLFELNQNNKHWVDVQNTFVNGTTLTVKQFDNKKYSNQVATDGIKTIVNSGYNYTPELYFGGADSKIYFQFNGGVQGENLLVTNQSNYFISGSDPVTNPPQYPLKVITSAGIGKATGFIYNIFDKEINDTSGYYTPGVASSNTFPTFKAPYAGSRTFNTSFGITVTFPVTAQTITYNFELWRKPSGGSAALIPDSTITQAFTSFQTAGGTTPGVVAKNNSGIGIWNNDPIQQGGTVTVTGPFSINSAPAVGDLNSKISYARYSYSKNIPYPPFTKYTLEGLFPNKDFTTPDMYPYFSFMPNDASPTLFDSPPTSATTAPPVSNLTTTLTFDSSVTINCAPNDEITFRLQEILNADSANYTSTVSVGSLAMVESILQGSYSYATSSNSGTPTPFITKINNGAYGQITMSADLTNFYGYQQVPYFTSASQTFSSSIYQSQVGSGSYGDINTSFLPQPSDAIVLRDIYGVSQVVSVYSSSFYSASNSSPLQAPPPSKLVLDQARLPDHKHFG